MFGICAGEPAFADHAGVWLPADQAQYPAQKRMLQRGELHYCLDAVAASYPNFRSQMAEVANYAASRGMVPAKEVSPGADCDIYYQAPSHSGFTSLCGSGAYGCIFYWRLPVDVYIDLQGPNAAFYNNSTICHEGVNTGHFMGLHEQYDDRNFRSNGKTWTCMDFGVRQPGDPLGRNVWALPDWDRDRIFNVFVPDAPSTVGLAVNNGWATVTWSQNRKDSGAAHQNGIVANTNATHMGFGWSAQPGSEVHNVSEWCPAAFNYCAIDYKAGQRSFDSFWKGCLYTWTWNNSFGGVPQVSPTGPNNWNFVGCW